MVPEERWIWVRENVPTRLVRALHDTHLPDGLMDAC